MEAACRAGIRANCDQHKPVRFFIIKVSVRQKVKKFHTLILALLSRGITESDLRHNEIHQAYLPQLASDPTVRPWLLADPHSVTV
jgi:hypothetical protein